VPQTISSSKLFRFKPSRFIAASAIIREARIYSLYYSVQAEGSTRGTSDLKSLPFQLKSSQEYGSPDAHLT